LQFDAPVFPARFFMRGRFAMAEITDAAMRVRQMYAEGAKLVDIYAATKLKFARIYFWIDGGDGAVPPLPRRRTLGHGLGKTSSRRSLIQRLMRLAEQQVDEVERRTTAIGVKHDPEGNGRAISVLARTIRDLTTLDAAARTHALKREQGKQNDEAVSPDIDELRRQLIRKMDALIADQQDEDAGGGERAPS
jgi:uncharacterized protein YjcR